MFLAAAVLAAALVLGGAHVTARAQGAASPHPMPTPYPLPTGALDANSLMTSPDTLPTPANLPYPVYGSPVPGVNRGFQPVGIPAQVSLDEAVAIGVAMNPLLASARADAQLAKVSVDLARTAVLPNFYGTASWTRSYGNLSQRTGAGVSGNQIGPYYSSNTDLSLTLQQLVFDGGKTAAAIHAASRNQVAQVDTYRREIQTVAYNVATAYYNVLSARRTTYVDLELVRQNQVQEDLVRAQLRAGTASKVDLATAELPTAKARLSLIQAQGAELTQRATLANSMGLDANALIEPVDDPKFGETSLIPSGTTLAYDHQIARALALRPDYDSALQTVQSDQYSLTAAERGYFPTITGTATYGTSSSSAIDGVGGGFSPSGSGGFALNLPIFNQGITRANVEQARANLQLAQANLASTRLGVELSVKQALVAVVSAREGVVSANAEYTEAVEVLQATRAQYKAGVTTLPLLLNAQVQLTQALTDQTTAIYTLRQAELSLFYAVGETAH